MSNAAWPVIAGTYAVGDPQGPVAVCVLTSEQLIDPLVQIPGVAIAGKVYTANLGIERIAANILANPEIRFLLLCGKDSPLFRPGQSLVALAERGVDSERRIIDALGYEPVLPSLTAAQVAQFRQQIEVIDWAGEEDVGAIEPHISRLVARNPGRYMNGGEAISMVPGEERFTTIRPGGPREPLQYDPKGYFVITVDREEEQIVVRHYLPDHTPAHEMRGRVAGSMFLGLVREGLVTQLSHAGYLGEELTKAQIALHQGWRYDQDRLLRPPETEAGSAASPQTAAMPENSSMPTATAKPPSMAQMQPPLTWAQLQATPPGSRVDVVLSVTDLPAADRLVGTFLDPDEVELFSAYHRTAQQLQVRWTDSTKIVMGGSADVRAGAVVRVQGEFGTDRVVEATLFAILTNVTRIIEP